MFTTPEDWALVGREMFAQAADAQVQFAGFDQLVAQELADKRSWSDLEGFYSEAASVTLKPADFERVRSKAVSGFEAGLVTLLRDALARAHKDRQIKAVYCEYSIDKDNHCHVAVHLCTAFSEDTEDWANKPDSRKETLSGAALPELFPAAMGSRKDSFAAAVMGAYINARLLAAWGRAAHSLNPVLPMGFGRTNFPVVRLSPYAK